MRRGEGARLRRSPQGDAQGHGDPDGRFQVITEELGLKLENVTLKDLGTAKRVIIDKDNTTIIEGAGEQAAHIEGSLQARSAAQIETTTSSDYDREKLQERLAKLVGGVAVVKVGAATEARDEGEEGSCGGCPLCDAGSR